MDTCRRYGSWFAVGHIHRQLIWQGTIGEVCNGLFTPSTRTRQNCLVLTAVVFTPPMWTRQDSFVLSVSVVWTRLEMQQNCLVLSAVGRQDKTVLSCPCRRCEQAIIVANWKLVKTRQNLSKLGRDKTKLRSDSCFYATYRAFINCFSSSSSVLSVVWTQLETSLVCATRKTVRKSRINA